MKHEIYTPPSSTETLELLTAAREINAKLDQENIAAGRPTPMQCRPDIALRCAISALICGIENRNFSVVAGGVVLLQDIELRCRQVISDQLVKQAESN